MGEWRGMQSAQYPWISLLLVALIVVRFLMRELRVRRMALSRIWYAPAFVGAVAVWLAYLTWSQAPYLAGTLAIAVVAAVPVGAALGWLVARFTTVQGGADGVAIVRGSWTTVVIWLAAFALRYMGRIAVGSAGLGEQFMLNTALVVLVGVALAFVRWRIVVAASTAPAQAIRAA